MIFAVRVDGINQKREDARSWIRACLEGLMCQPVFPKFDKILRMHSQYLLLHALQWKVEVGSIATFFRAGSACPHCCEKTSGAVIALAK